MCLDEVHVIRPKPEERTIWAWKVFDKRKDGLYPQFLSASAPHKWGTWMRADTRTIDDTHRYKLGWHAYLQTPTRELCHDPAYMQVAVRVKLKGVRVRGIHNSLGAVIADWMYIPLSAKAKLYHEKKQRDRRRVKVIETGSADCEVN